MLSSLRINNVALIDKLSVEFVDGLNVLSGETGAGKSIIIDALSFVLGGKINKNLIRNGCDNMRVEALFAPPFSEQVHEVVTDLGLELEEDMMISRTYSTNNKSDIRFNGQLISLAMLKSISAYLVDIHGQHEHQSLLKEKEHIKIIDGFRQQQLSLLKKELAQLIDEYKDICKQIMALGTDESQRARTLDLLKYQIDEINSFGLKENEEQELVELKSKYINSEKIATSMLNSYNNLGGNSNEIAGAIKRAQSELYSISKYGEEFSSWAERLDSTRIELEDIIDSIQDYNNNFVFDEAEFNRVDSRLDNIKLMKKKYGSSYEDIQKFLAQATLDYNNLLDSGELLKKLSKDKLGVFDKIYDKCSNLSDIRREISKQFEGKVITELNDLGMKNSSFVVEFEDRPAKDIDTCSFDYDGFDKVRFVFSANLGQPLRPLSDIISGGEMSRFMLAIKNIIADKDKIQTVVFDEIDTGISGHIGYVIACKMANISKLHQVLSVTHLPQISAMADARYLISKTSSNNDTITSIQQLSSPDGEKEVARLSGGEDSDTSIAHARELINRCQSYKAKM